MLGVLGGMGPMATADFMAKVTRLTPAARDQDHIPMVVCSATRIPDRIAALRGTGPDPLPAMREALRILEAAGAERVAIPCNTAHHWHAALQAGTRLPILHIVEAVAEALPGPEGGPVGLLATRGTLEAGIYPARLAPRGYACRVPDAAGQAEVVRGIALVKAGEIGRAASVLRPQAEALAAAGCARVVLACTEIPLALADTGDDLRAVLVDATEALARACVRACLKPNPPVA